jgi:hypothetical protein
LFDNFKSRLGRKKAGARNGYNVGDVSFINRRIFINGFTGRFDIKSFGFFFVNFISLSG